MLSINKDQLKYTSCYCEENIYLLCKTIKDQFPSKLDDCFVIFISNKKEQIPMWYQRRGQILDEGLVVWDYHVILLVKDTQSGDQNKKDYIYDFDTLLSFPSLFSTYVQKSFRPFFPLLDKYKRSFRKIPAKVYLDQFASDRSHMLDNGIYKAPPPDYPPIISNYETNTLPYFRDMTQTTNADKYGKVVSEDEFFRVE